MQRPDEKPVDRLMDVVSNFCNTEENTVDIKGEIWARTRAGS